MCCGDDEETEDQVDYDPSHKGPKGDGRSCTDVLCLLLLVIFLGVWAGVAVYGFTRGNPHLLLHPSNSEGEICGRGDHEDKPNLLFFDLSRCVKISAALAGCATPQVCVAQCPDSYWTYKQGKQDGLSDFCTDLSPGELEGTTVETLGKYSQSQDHLS